MTWRYLLLALVHGAFPSSVPLVAAPYEISVPNFVQPGIFPRSVSTLEKRIAPKNLGVFSLALNIPKNDVMFTVTDQSSNGQNAAVFSVTCVSCYTTGIGNVSTTSVSASIGTEIEEIFGDPTELIINALGLNLEVKIQGFSGHFEFDISFMARKTYTFPLFRPEDPIGVQDIGSGNFAGIVFAIDLVFNVDAAIHFTTGFEISIPDGAYFVINPITGDIISHDFSGVRLKSLPVHVTSGSACMTASLRISARAGLEVEVDGTGLDFEAGIFIDAPSYKACLTSSNNCALEFTEEFYGDIGVYARAVLELDYHSLSAGPTAATTFWTANLPSACVESGSLPSSIPPITSSRPSPSPTPVSQPPCGTGLLVCEVEDPTRLEAPWHGVWASFPQCYDPSLYICAANFLCPTNAPKIAGQYACGPYSTTCTNWTISLLTITGCSSNLDWCPSTLRSEATITKTICALGDATKSGPAAAPPTTISSVTIISPVPMSALATPSTSIIEVVNILTEVITRSIWIQTTIISSFLSLQTIPLYVTTSSYIITLNSTFSLGSNAATSTATVITSSTQMYSSPTTSPQTSSDEPASAGSTVVKGLGGVIVSMGGYR